MRHSIFALAMVALLAACAGTPEAGAPRSPTDPAELARELVRAGAVQSEVERVVEGYRRIVANRVAAHIDGLEKELESLPEARRRRGLEFSSQMPARLEQDLTVFLDSVDFGALGVELFAPLFEERLSREELSGLLDFYRSPAGRAWLRERTAVEEGTTRALVARMEPTMETFMRQWFEGELERLQEVVAPGPPGSVQE